MAAINFTPREGAFAQSLAMQDVLNHRAHETERHLNFDDLSLQEIYAITFRPPLLVSFKDRENIWHRCDFKMAPTWEYWNRLPQNFRDYILLKNQA